MTGSAPRAVDVLCRATHGKGWNLRKIGYPAYFADPPKTYTYSLGAFRQPRIEIKPGLTYEREAQTDFRKTSPNRKATKSKQTKESYTQISADRPTTESQKER